MPEAKRITTVALAMSLMLVSYFSRPAICADSAKITQLLQTMTNQYNSGQYVQAGRTGQQILAIDVNNMTAHYMMGNIFLKAQELDSAGDQYDWCVAHGGASAIAKNSQNALDVMEGKKAPSAPARTTLPITRLAGQANAVPPMRGFLPQTLPTEFSNPYNPQTSSGANPDPGFNQGYNPAPNLNTVLNNSGHAGPSAETPQITKLLQTMTAQYNAGQYAPAGRTGQQVLGLDANNLSAHYMMGNIFLRAQELDSAGDQYDWCVAHGAGTAIAINAQRALDVMEGRVSPAAAHAALPIIRMAGQAAQSSPQSQAQLQAPQLQQTTSQSTAAFTHFDPYSNVNINGQEQLMMSERFGALHTPREDIVQPIQRFQDQMLMDRLWIDVKKEVMDGLIQKENDEAVKKIAALRTYTIDGKTSVSHLDYTWQNEVIWKAARAHTKVLMDKFEEEKRKLTEDYDMCANNMTAPAFSPDPNRVFWSSSNGNSSPNFGRGIRNFGTTPASTGTKTDTNTGTSKWGPVPDTVDRIYK